MKALSTNRATKAIALADEELELRKKLRNSVHGAPRREAGAGENKEA